MYNQPYFIPSYYSGMMSPMMRGSIGMGNALRGAGAIRGVGSLAGASKGAGLFSRLGSSISAIRGINWGGFINNASKTLGVINQTIPLVRQVGPMVNNMKSMLKVASLFKDETDKNPTNRSNNSNYRFANTSSGHSYQRETISNQSIKNNSTESSEVFDNNRENSYDNSPTFFIAS